MSVAKENFAKVHMLWYGLELQSTLNSLRNSSLPQIRNGDPTPFGSLDCIQADAFQGPIVSVVRCLRQTPYQLSSRLRESKPFKARTVLLRSSRTSTTEVLHLDKGVPEPGPLSTYLAASARCRAVSRARVSKGHAWDRELVAVGRLKPWYTGTR